MIVSWNWLKDYVDLGMPLSEAEQRLAMAGLNHESTEPVGDDFAIDLEVTSNRPDCLGHIGVAREIAVLWDQALKIPQPSPKSSSTSISDLTRVTIDAPELCPRYTARLIRGIKVGPSPDWMTKRLATLGLASICNVVDITNYVMMECGQPLHAFDFAKLDGGKIVVRDAKKDEPFVAIDHREYSLRPGMCVIADQTRPVALAGVMGGADTEVSSETADLLIESADFAPLSIRSTARALRLHSPSSYRFERGVDPVGIEWASLRAAEMILELAGGELVDGVIDVQPNKPAIAAPVVLRFSQLKRILGIELEVSRVVEILERLGLEHLKSDRESGAFQSPTWRRDLTREIDLIEEVARIHGYDEIPEDVGVPMAPSHRRDVDRVKQTVRQVLLASGFSEAMTASVVDEKHSTAFSPWSSIEPIRASTPMLRGANCLRRSLIPSLLEARKVNESLANETIELFETAKIYLPRPGQLPDEPVMLSLTSGRDFSAVKGVIETLLAALHIDAQLEVEPANDDFFDAGQSCQLRLNGDVLGYLGLVGQKAAKAASLRNPTTIAELKFDVLQAAARLVPQFSRLSPYPAISHDFNFIVDEAVTWAALSESVRQAAGRYLERIDYQETYRDPERDGVGRKRLLLSVRLRSADQTMTGEQADEIRQAIITACEQQHAAGLLS
ncbi:MAG: phenylalanine--tRNA ligase subunit beta [Planctomycetaceae bacterium]|nr:phenylalanine--tRNA ligase subunit beta [Planctomycetaceae bacterium]